MHLFFFQAEDGIRAPLVTGVQTCALPISTPPRRSSSEDMWREATLIRLLASRRRMTRLRSGMASLMRATRSAASDEPLEHMERHRLGAAAHLVHGTHARRTTGGTRAALQRLEAAREE